MNKKRPQRSRDYKVFGRGQGIQRKMWFEDENRENGILMWAKGVSKGTDLGKVNGRKEKVNVMKSLNSEICTPSSKEDQRNFSKEKSMLSKLSYSHFSIKY
uniref:acylphosphatase n=1 Tax=Sus scrofa TaxID=9823 RepID=A0A8D1MLF1_PIG